jgi:predicted permease
MRLAYRISYLLFVASSHLAAWLAADFRTLARASQRWGALVVPLQLPVLVAWCPARAVSLVSFAACRALAPRLS